MATSKEALTSYLSVSHEAPLEKQCYLQQTENRMQRLGRMPVM